MNRVELLRFIERKPLLLYKAYGAGLKRLSDHGSPVSGGWQLGNKMLHSSKGCSTRHYKEPLRV